MNDNCIRKLDVAWEVNRLKCLLFTMLTGLSILPEAV